ncbi:E3 ubiquitin-protein ligase Rnf220-like isoform X2 [Ptychodera flava]|uniref:E3 ubiquitin-protein ligase Rnf220-like isoform X2 n=1 Tax=Ptychodera flava TaxID=63121 RepID=UPI00396A3FD3
MENSTFLPQHLGTPGLMVLASTAEATRDPMRPTFQGEQLPPGLEKDAFPGFHALFQRQNMTEFFSPRDFPHHFITLPQFRHSFEATRFLSTAGAGAFRRFNSEERENAYSSAFVPTKRGKPPHLGGVEASGLFFDPERAKDFPFSRMYEKDDFDKEHSKGEMKKEKEECLSGTTVELQSSPSDNGSTDRSSPEDDHIKRNLQLHHRNGQKPVCPVCGETLQPGEITHHFAVEMDKVNKMERISRKSLQEKKISSNGSSVEESGTVTSDGKKNTKEGHNGELSSVSRFENFQRVRSNRQNRLQAARLRKKKRTSSEIGASTGSDANNGMEAGTSTDAASGSVVSESVCPICCEKISGTPEQINNHAEACIRKRNSPSNDDNVFEEYEWAGQTRVRVSTMLEGGYAASGFQVHKRKGDDGDSDVDLNVDGDDNEVYGPVQYSERDVIPCTSEEPKEERERRALRGAVLKAEMSSPVGSPSVDRTRWESSEHKGIDDKSKHIAKKQKTDTTTCDSEADLEGQNPTEVIASLKSRIHMLERHSKPDKFKCLICMETYHNPVVSVQCWHVHCEECWLRTLGAKKLCPQCNMITSPTDLRRIFL